MNSLLESPSTQGAIPDRLLSTDVQAFRVARDALTDIATHYGFAPDWSPWEHYQLMHDIFTEPTTTAIAAA